MVVPEAEDWELLYSSLPQVNDVSIVARAHTSQGTLRVQGLLTLEKYGKIYRVLLDGYEVVGGNKYHDAQRGERFRGAIYLPDSVPWRLQNEPKIVSTTSKGVKGGLTTIQFDPNQTGVTYFQLCILHNKNARRMNAKRAIFCIQSTLEEAAAQFGA